MKKLTAHDWEDMLQVCLFLEVWKGGTDVHKCAIPAFDGFISKPDNEHLLKLLFPLAYWQGLAKLCLHTEDTLGLLDKVTKDLGDSLHSFKVNTCLNYQTKELLREAAVWN